MERKVLKQESKNFWGRNFPGKNGTKEAKQWLDDCAEREGTYKVVLGSAMLQDQSTEEVLLTDDQGNIKHLRLSWLPLVGHRIVELDLRASDVKDITVRVSPDNLNNTLKYTSAGLLIGGVEAAIVGAVIDEVKGPKRGTITLFLEFGDSEEPYEEHITFCVRQMNLVVLNEDGLRRILKKAKAGLDKVSTLFPEKVQF